VLVRGLDIEITVSSSECPEKAEAEAQTNKECKCNRSNRARDDSSQNM